MEKTFTEAFRDPQLARALIAKIKAKSRKPVRLMEVCGTHTVAIFRSGIRSLLPPTITLLSGPGCPVCVTDQAEIDAFLAIAQIKEVIVTTFGDLMRVPGTEASLQQVRAQGGDVRMVYSTMDAVSLAKENPHKKVVFLGVGFETTAPTVAAAILAAQQMELTNFFVYCAHKLVPPALEALMANEKVNVDGFILPGHVSVIIGLDAYGPFFQKHKTPSVVAGFEPVDLLQAIADLVQQFEDHMPQLKNTYGRAVANEGNLQARQVLEQVLEPADAAWRGIGTIPASGLKIRNDFAQFDAAARFDIQAGESKAPPGCACGAVLTGVKTPPQCALYKKRCTPTSPVGPCMVSSEGVCAAYFRYHTEE